MPSQYQPKDHIQHLEVAPRVEGVLDQREITVQTYETTVPFDYSALDARIKAAWLSPAVRFGVFTRNPTTRKDAIHVVLGLQGDLSVRAYDYDRRRPIWFSWRDVIVDTVAVRYVRDENGCIRFTAAGGGVRITDEKLADFNSQFLKVPKQSARKLQFDLAKLRALCFNRFDERLYMLRFAGPSVEEYRSIDHASFQSRRYIDPAAERFQEIRSDTKVVIESFDSDIEVSTDDLASPIEVRFAVRGRTGSLRLRFPKVRYSARIETREEQTRVFYRLVDETVKSVLDSDYYASRKLSLAQLKDIAEFPQIADTTPYREALSAPEVRVSFFTDIDLAAPESEWLPHLRAINEMLPAEGVATHVDELIADLAKRNPGQAVRLLLICRTNAELLLVGRIVFRVLSAQLQALPAEVRAQAEESLLAWAVDHEESWDVDLESTALSVGTLTWRIEDLALDALPSVLWKVVGVLHEGLRASDGEAYSNLRKYDWCMAAAKEIPANDWRCPSALRLVREGRVPSSPGAAVTILKEPVSDLRELDDAVLNQFGLPLWPSLSASRTEGGIVVSNEGVGAALALTPVPTGKLFNDEGGPHPVDLLPGASATIPIAGSSGAVDLEFEKYGARHRVTVPVADSEAVAAPHAVKAVSSILSGKRIKAQRTYREEIDKNGVVVGASPAIRQVFEDIHYANAREDRAGVLILGEPGTGKTHIARLIHDASSRRERPFKAVNAGGSGGDVNIQRGEWIGYAKGHGISGIDPKGKAGHLMAVNGGTLFVDEFVVFSQELQAVFLSVLEGRAVQKVGGEDFEPDVRCIFATNADLDEAVEQGRLRRDLLDRIAVRIRVPPLRERRGDILPLARHFAGPEQTFSDKARLALLKYDWPANVRELQTTVASAMARLKEEGEVLVGTEHLPTDIVAAEEDLEGDDLRRELWLLADQIARDEGFTHGTGLQHRAAEIMGVGDSQASKMYRQFELADKATA